VDKEIVAEQDISCPVVHQVILVVEAAAALVQVVARVGLTRLAQVGMAHSVLYLV
jgi:hypothetical protein